jgi:hypothetical protein
MKDIFRTGRRPDLMRTAFILSILILIIVVLFVADGISSYKARYDETYLENVRNAIYDTLITCYALEGSYPDSLAYLSDHYGLVLDRDKYIFRYELIGSNLFPEFEVIPYSNIDTDQRTSIYGKEGGS